MSHLWSVSSPCDKGLTVVNTVSLVSLSKPMMKGVSVSEMSCTSQMMHIVQEKYSRVRQYETYKPHHKIERWGFMKIVKVLILIVTCNIGMHMKYKITSSLQPCNLCITVWHWVLKIIDACMAAVFFLSQELKEQWCCRMHGLSAWSICSIIHQRLWLFGNDFWHRANMTTDC